MRRFLDKAKSAIDVSFDGSNDHPKNNPHAPLQDKPSQIESPTLTDITRYRYHHGTNLGSVFIQERWLTGCMWEEGFQGSAELSCAEGWIKQFGMDRARTMKFEKHWRDYISDADLDWLRDVAKCTSVRLPIGWFVLGAEFCDGTAFKKVAPLYANAWQAVKHLVARCHSRGIGVLIDVHGLPGGANKGEHSGTNSGKPEFWESSKFRKLATKGICFIARETKGMPGIAGIQVVNEAEWDSLGMYDWYDDILCELAHIDPHVPIYISDGWDLNRCLNWSQTRNTIGARNPVVVDTHVYWCFTDADQQKSPQQITGEASRKLAELDGKEGDVVKRGACQAIVGEYSCVLGEKSWAKGGCATKNDLVREFGMAQSQRYQQRAGGSFFWTYRMDWMDGGEWGFKQMTDQHAIAPPKVLTLDASDVKARITSAERERDHRRGSTWGKHCSYWDSNYPGHYEHHRFKQGWSVGWKDALEFFRMRSQHGFQGGDKVGMLDLWVLKRLRESGQGGSFVWEWEQGFRHGVRDFYECAGI